MRKSADGDVLFRHLEIKVVFPDKIFPDRKFKHNAPAGKGFSEDNIDAMLEQIADQLEQLYPFWEFKDTTLAPRGGTARHLISFAGYKIPPTLPAAENPPTTESTTPAPEAAGLAQNDEVPAASGVSGLEEPEFSKTKPVVDGDLTWKPAVGTA